MTYSIESIDGTEISCGFSNLAAALAAARRTADSTGDVVYVVNAETDSTPIAVEPVEAE